MKNAKQNVFPLSNLFSLKQTMSHTIKLFPNSNIITVEGDTFFFARKDPDNPYPLLISYNIKTKDINQIRWIFGDIDDLLVKNSTAWTKLGISTKYDGRDKISRLPKYSNIQLYPELETILKSHDINFISYLSYERNHSEFQLDVWHGKGYVVRTADEIRTVHILEDEENIAEPDIWASDENFFVFSHNDCTDSVMLIIYDQL